MEDSSPNFFVPSGVDHNCGKYYGYPNPPSIIIPPRPNSQYGIDDTSYLAKLALASYDFMLFYQNEHFMRMIRIAFCSPGTAPRQFLPQTMIDSDSLMRRSSGSILQACSNPIGFVEFPPSLHYDPQAHQTRLLDPFFARPKSPGRAINEGHINPTARDEYNPNWI
eukprot:scaffold175295_cov72-Attheya_sp.AAC.1